jgi:transketolase
MRRAFVNSLESLAESDKKVNLLVLDVGFGVLESFQNKFPSQYLNVGIAEQNAVSFATGMALKGKIPFLYSINSFLAFRAYEQIRECAHMKAHVVMVGTGLGDEYTNYGISHDATGDDIALVAIRGLKLWTPQDREEVPKIIKEAYTAPQTHYIRLSRFGSLKK